MRANGFLIEDKFTDAASFTITRAMVEKNIAEALQTPPGLLPMLRITMPGLPKLRLVREDDMLYLIARAGATQDQ